MDIQKSQILPCEASLAFLAKDLVNQVLEEDPFKLLQNTEFFAVEQGGLLSDQQNLFFNQLICRQSNKVDRMEIFSELEQFFNAKKIESVV